MKKVILATFFPVLMAGSLPSQAAESATINIKGSIVPTSCSVTVVGSADYGELYSTDVGKADEKGYALPKKEIPVNVSCGAAMPVALSFQADELASTTSSVHLPNINAITEENKNRVGVLGVNGNKPIGYYNMGLVSATSDFFKGGLVTTSPDAGASWEADWVSGFSTALDSSEWVGQPSTPITDLTMVLSINATLDPKGAVSATDAIEFSTNTTVSLHYL